MKSGQRREEVLLIGLASLALAVGTAVYAFDRGDAYFLGSIFAGQGDLPLFGPLAGQLPTFLHTLAFILLTAAVLRPWPRSLPAIAVFWFALECLFEIGQRNPWDEYITASLPGWFSHVPFLEASEGYFVRGTFDPLDLCSIGLGAAVAVLSVRFVMQRGAS